MTAAILQNIEFTSLEMMRQMKLCMKADNEIDRKCFHLLSYFPQHILLSINLAFGQK